MNAAYFTLIICLSPPLLSLARKKKGAILQPPGCWIPAPGWGEGQGKEQTCSMRAEIKISIRACGSSDYTVLRLCQCRQTLPQLGISLAWHLTTLLAADPLNGLPFPPPCLFNGAVGSKYNLRSLSTIPSPSFSP